MKILLGIVMIAFCAGANAQGIHKCVSKDGKTSYSADPCPGSKEIVAPGRQPTPPAAKGADAKKDSTARPAGGSVVAFPELQPGKWKLRVTRKGRTNDNETCGDPIDGMRREVQEYSDVAKAKWGCTMTTNQSAPRSVRIVYDCPSDRSPEGRPVQKGRWELSLVSPTPQAFRLDMTSTTDGPYSMDGTRVGECGK